MLSVYRQLIDQFQQLQVEWPDVVSLHHAALQGHVIAGIGRQDLPDPRYRRIGGKDRTRCRIAPVRASAPSRTLSGKAARCPEEEPDIFRFVSFQSHPIKEYYSVSRSASAHWFKALRMGWSFRALSVSPYSTRIGTSRYSDRSTSPSSSISFKVLDSMVLEIPQMFFSSSLYRLVPFESREQRIGSFHFPPMAFSAPCRTHSGEQGLFYKGGILSSQNKP